MEQLIPLLHFDVVNLIFNEIKDGKTYKAMLETCKYFCDDLIVTKNLGKYVVNIIIGHFVCFCILK